MALQPTDTGLRLADLSQLGGAITSENELAVAAAQTATGTTQATSLVISNVATIIEITTTPASSGVMLPISVPGLRGYICNNGANTLRVYTNINETATSPKINGTAGATGVTQVAGNNAMYVCMTAGQWYRVSGT